MSGRWFPMWIAVLVLVISCGSPARSGELTKVKCSEAVRGFFFVPLYLAHGLGVFQKQGLEVEIISAQGGPAAMQALAAGQVEFCATGHGQVANMFAKGKSTKIVNLMQDKCTFSLVGRPEIKGIAALKGKAIGCTLIGAETYAVGRFLARKAGLDPEKDVTLVAVGGMATMASALENDRVQAVMSWQPLTLKLLQEGKGVMLASLNTAANSEKHFGSPAYSFSVLQVTDELIKQRPELVRQFVRALVEAEKWIASHSADEIAKVVTPYFSGMTQEIVAASVEGDRDAFSSTGIVTKEGHETAVKIFMDAGVFTTPVPFEGIVDNSFSEKAGRK
ncbi:MAG: ABC transporter substrate-binding protein [Pseudomonadota bacterium]